MRSPAPTRAAKTAIEYVRVSNQEQTNAGMSLDALEDK